MPVLQRLLLGLFTATLVSFAGWSSAALARPSAADAVAPGSKAESPNDAPPRANPLPDPQFERLERIADWLRAVRRQDVLGRTATAPALAGVDEFDPIALARQIDAEIDALQTLDAQLDAEFAQQLADLTSRRAAQALKQRHQQAQQDLKHRLIEFRQHAQRLRAALRSGQAAQIRDRVAALADFMAGFDAARGAVRLDPRSIRQGLAEPSDRPPGASADELIQRLDPAGKSLAGAITTKAAPTEADLGESDEVQLTPAIRALADQLGGSPLAIYDWVVSNIDFAPTYGVIQGADLTLQTRRGNAADSNALLVALLRASGIAARFVYGVIELPAAQAQNWVGGLRTPFEAVDLLQKGGVPTGIVTAGGAISAVRLEHVWVEAYVDFVPSRGAKHRQGDSWVPLDASFKRYDSTAPVNLLSAAQWNAQAAYDSLLTSAQRGPGDAITRLDFAAYDGHLQGFLDRAEAYLAQHQPGGDELDLLGQRRIRPQQSPLLSGTLPYRVLLAGPRFSALPDTLKHFIDVSLYATASDVANDNPALHLRMPSSRLGLRSLYVNYAPSSDADARLIQSYHDSHAASLPVSALRVTPKLELAGEVLASGGPTAMGAMQYWTVTVRDPHGHGGIQHEPYQLAAGSRLSFTLNLGEITASALEATLDPLPDVARLPIAQALHLAGLQYWHLNDRFAASVARGWGGGFSRLPSVGAFSAPLTVRYFFGVPRTAYHAGFATDIKADRVAITHSDRTKSARMLLQIGANGSLSEGLTWDLLFGDVTATSLSASSILAWANDNGVPIYTLHAGNLADALPRIQASADVKSEIAHAVAAGYQVIVPERAYADGRASAMGYVVVDPESGAAAYRVEGGMNGALRPDCVVQAVILFVLCKKRFMIRLMERIARWVARSAVMAVASALMAPAAPALFVVGAVALSIEVLMTAYEITSWVMGVINGTINLDDADLAELGITALNDAICSYTPECFLKGRLANLLGAGQFVMDFGGWAVEAVGAVIGNPVAVASGVKYQSETDYLGSGPFPLRLERHYVSYLPNGSIWGHKWRGGYDRKIERTPKSALGADTAADLAERPDTVLAMRGDGGMHQFVYRNGGYLPQGSTPEQLERLTDNADRTLGWLYRNVADEIERYDLYGRLTQIETRAGLKQTLRYNAAGQLQEVRDDFGRTLSFTYDANSGQVATARDPEGRSYLYRYTELGSLASVQYPDDTQRHYHYETPGWGSLLTGITDERGVRYATWRYDYKQRVVESIHAGGADHYRLQFDGDNRTTVTDPEGAQRSYQFEQIGDDLHLVGQSLPCNRCSAGGTATSRFDTAGNPIEVSDFNGNRVTMRWNARGLLESETRAADTPLAQTRQMQWHPHYRLPLRLTEPAASGGSKVTEWSYDPRGNLLSQSITADGQTRSWRYSYNVFGQVESVDGPRSDVADIERTRYSPASGLPDQRIDANNLITRFTRYDAHGQVLEQIDANGRLSRYRYDRRDRLIELATGAEGGQAFERTGFDYDAVGNLTRTTLPDGSYLAYRYDAAQRLDQISDALGNQIDYGLNASGERIAEHTFDPQGRLAATVLRVVDALGRVEAVSGFDTAAATRLRYDDNGNLTDHHAPLHGRPTRSEYDALDRLSHSIDPLLGEIAFGYDAQNNLRSISDPRQLVTRYDYNGFDELVRLDSPDSGRTDYSFDAASNLTQRTDARDITASYRYDAGNRLVELSYPDETLRFDYDEPSGGPGAQGRLTGLDSTAIGSGSLAISNRLTWSYDIEGRVRSRVQQIGDNPSAATTRQVDYDYSDRGQLERLTLPSGAQIDYRYGSDGRIVTITVNGVEIVREIEYIPFSGPKAWITANGGRYLRQIDADGRIVAHSLGEQTRSLDYDAADRITAISDADGSDWRYDYDDLDRLIGADNAAGHGPTALQQLDWSYDATGNRLSETSTVGSTPSTTDYTIGSSSNRLDALSGALSDRRQYDPAGNTIQWKAQRGAFGNAVLQASYSGRNRLVEIRQGSSPLARYAYNGLGERIGKWLGDAAPSAASAPPNIQFVYDEAGHLLGEYDASGHLIAEHIWLDDTPVAVLRPDGSGAGGLAIAGSGTAPAVESFFIHPDHLDTPRLIENAARQVVWKWESAPFGDTDADTQPTEGLTAFGYALRFPGQYADLESGGYYNYFRDYEADTGRYWQSDPIGLLAGVNTYAYVDLSPLAFFDSFGLAKSCDDCGIASYSKQPTPVPTGFQRHHIIQDAWARANKPSGYSYRGAPSILLAFPNHVITNNRQGARARSRSASGGTAYGSTLREEFNFAAGDLAAAGVSEKCTRRALKRAYKYFDLLGAFR